MGNTRICSVESCGKPAKGLGYCHYHYQVNRRTGSPIPKPGHAQWVLERVSYSGDDCLLWPFRPNGVGYGSITYKGTKENAHRLMCRLAHGEPVAVQEARHKCRNRLCCNPNHLEWGTRSQNMADKVRDGTHNRGTRNPLAKIDDATALKIYAMRGQMSQRKIADLFGISQRTVFSILHGEKWAWLTQNAAMPQKV